MMMLHLPLLSQGKVAALAVGRDKNLNAPLALFKAIYRSSESEELIDAAIAAVSIVPTARVSSCRTATHRYYIIINDRNSSFERKRRTLHYRASDIFTRRRRSSLAALAPQLHFASKSTDHKNSTISFRLSIINVGFASLFSRSDVVLSPLKTSKV